MKFKKFLLFLRGNYFKLLINEEPNLKNNSLKHVNYIFLSMWFYLIYIVEFVGWHEIEATPAIILIKFMSHPSPPTDGDWRLQ